MAKYTKEHRTVGTESRDRYRQEYEEEDQTEKISLAMLIDDLWKGLKKYFLLMLAIVAAGAGFFYMQARISYQPTYESYATFVVVVSDGYGYSMDYYNRTTASQLSKTFPDILESTELRTIVAEDLGTAGVPGSISAEVMEGTALFTLKVSAAEPELSYNILQSVITNYPKVAEFIIGDSRLTLLDESGVPTAPSNALNASGQVKKGAMIGAAIAAALLFLYALTRKTVRTTDDMEKKVSLAYLGSVPQVKFKKRSRESRVLMDSREHSRILGDCFRSLRTRVLQELSEDNKKIVVLSALDKEGKTTVAANIALSLALKNKKVLLIEGNLRNPSLISALGLEQPLAGLEQTLQGKASLADAMLRYKKTTLHVLPAAAASRNSTELLSGERMQKLMTLAERDYDYIVLDGPAVTSPDASILVRYADSAILTVKQDHASIDKILSAIETVRDADLQAIGYILNSTQVGITGYGYGYGRESEKEKKSTRRRARTAGSGADAEDSTASAIAKGAENIDDAFGDEGEN
ncbi:MAG: polysaccharide biosynthesis tyrosine autokinase [Lachnospiraceae bacterium]|nr:polysaccharide biosynthesis tyrosine autokinase [Lachnospiraceae bacterium]